MTSEKRTRCLCDHDLLWHGVGLGKNACQARTFRSGWGYPCHCQGFRTSIPGETLPEPDLLQMLWRLDLAISRLADRLDELLPDQPSDTQTTRPACEYRSPGGIRCGRPMGHLWHNPPHRHHAFVAETDR